MTRVLIVSPGLSDPMGGAAISEASLAQGLMARGCGVDVVCHKKKVQLSFLKRYHLSLSATYDLGQWLRAFFFKSHPLRQLVATADIIHLNGHWKLEYFLISQLCIRLHKPYVLHPRGMLLTDYGKKKLKKIFNFCWGKSIVQKASKIILLSEYERNDLSAYDVKDSKIAVLPNGVYHTKKGLEKIRSLASSCSSPSQAEQAHFLYIGRIEPRKNLTFLVQAFSEYRNQGGGLKLKLIGPVEKAYDKTLRLLIKTLGLEQEIFLKPPAYGDDKWGCYQRATAVVYPTSFEPFGRVPFESLLLKKVTLVPFESGGFEYLGSHLPWCGYVGGSLESLAQALARVEKKVGDPKQEKVIEGASSWVGEELRWDSIAHKVEVLYQQVISEMQLDIFERALESTGETTLPLSEPPHHQR